MASRAPKIARFLSRFSRHWIWLALTPVWLFFGVLPDDYKSEILSVVWPLKRHLDRPTDSRPTWVRRLSAEQIRKLSAAIQNGPKCTVTAVGYVGDSVGIALAGDIQTALDQTQGKDFSGAGYYFESADAVGVFIVGPDDGKFKEVVDHLQRVFKTVGIDLIYTTESRETKYAKYDALEIRVSTGGW